MLEGDFRQALQKGLEHQGLWMVKIPDLARAIKKPCDLVACDRGRFWMIEAKLTKLDREPASGFKPKDVVLKLSDFRKHQLDNLQKIYAIGGKAFGAVCLTYHRPGLQPKRAWMLPYAFIEGADVWRLADLERLPETELVWKPNVGWTCSENLLNGD